MEKTLAVYGPSELTRKHLHGRGEDCDAGDRSPKVLRNTSTDGEKTTTIYSLSIPDWKHLHGRGEDLLFGLPSCAVPETPPRTWRRRRACHRHRPGNGNTSTDVEKTRISALAPTEFWKHLHGRGEDANKRKGANIAVETPPRTWRRRRHLVVGKKATGNTSTDVEKTRS